MRRWRRKVLRIFIGSIERELRRSAAAPAGARIVGARFLRVDAPDGDAAAGAKLTGAKAEAVRAPGPRYFTSVVRGALADPSALSPESALSPQP